MKENNKNISKSSGAKKQISESRISENLNTNIPRGGAGDIPGLPSPFFSEDDVKEVVAVDKLVEALQEQKLYTIDDLIDVWCRGVTNGATLWQYCQDTSRPLPSSFEAGLIELVNEIRKSEDKPRTLQDFVNNNMILLGVFDEKL